MPLEASDSVRDHGQGRVRPQQDRSKASRESLIRAAMELWRTNGFATTSVSDICRAAGVSKALFYVYFARKEDLLIEAGLLSAEEANEVARRTLTGMADLEEAVRTVLAALEAHMHRYPPELTLEAVLESYRRDRVTALADPQAPAPLFADLLRQARTDGLLPPVVDLDRAARTVQDLATDGIRHWTAGRFPHEGGFAETVAGDIAAYLTGLAARSAPSASS